jgi:hypothetical protein
MDRTSTGLPQSDLRLGRGRAAPASRVIPARRGRGEPLGGERLAFAPLHERLECAGEMLFDETVERTLRSANAPGSAHISCLLPLRIADHGITVDRNS